jgi:uncharacterized membrane protein YhaH (DUF805 family)
MFAGTAPIIQTLLVTTYTTQNSNSNVISSAADSRLRPAFYIMSVSVLSLFALVVLVPRVTISSGRLHKAATSSTQPPEPSQVAGLSQQVSNPMTTLDIEMQPIVGHNQHISIASTDCVDDSATGSRLVDNQEQERPRRHCDSPVGSNANIFAVGGGFGAFSRFSISSLSLNSSDLYSPTTVNNGNHTVAFASPAGHKPVRSIQSQQFVQSFVYQPQQLLHSRIASGTSTISSLGSPYAESLFGDTRDDNMNMSADKRQSMNFSIRRQDSIEVDLLQQALYPSVDADPSHNYAAFASINASRRAHHQSFQDFAALSLQDKPSQFISKSRSLSLPQLPNDSGIISTNNGLPFFSPTRSSRRGAGTTSSMHRVSQALERALPPKRIAAAATSRVAAVGGTSGNCDVVNDCSVRQPLYDCGVHPELDVNPQPMNSEV